MILDPADPSNLEIEYFYKTIIQDWNKRTRAVKRNKKNSKSTRDDVFTNCTLRQGQAGKVVVILDPANASNLEIKEFYKAIIQGLEQENKGSEMEHPPRFPFTGRKC